MVYPGSKSRLAPIFIPMLNGLIKNKNITSYIEPFVGGGNIFDGIVCQEQIGYDKSRTLIALFNQGLENINAIPEEGSREWWDAAKAQYRGEVPQSMPNWKIGAIQYFASSGTRGFPDGLLTIKTEKIITMKGSAISKVKLND